MSHGLEKNSLQQHEDKPFRISGVLKPTGTPMDRAILISLEGIEALHIDWANGAPSLPAFAVSAEGADNGSSAQQHHGLLRRAEVAGGGIPLPAGGQ